MLDSLKETKDFDAIKSGRVKHKPTPTAKGQEQTVRQCGYCGLGNSCQQCPAYRTMCGICGRPTTSKQCAGSTMAEGVQYIK